MALIDRITRTNFVPTKIPTRVSAEKVNEIIDFLNTYAPNGTLAVNTIAEQTAGNGIVIDSVTLKDGKVLTTTAPVSYLLPVMGVGVYGTPVSDVVAVDNIAFTVNMRAGLDKTDPLASSMAAYIGTGNTVTTATPNACLQGILVTNTIANSCYSAYGVQANMTSSAIGEINANGMMVSLAGSITLAHGNASGCISPGYFILQANTGPYALGATAYGIWVDILGLTGVTAGITVVSDAASVVNAGLYLSGGATTSIKHAIKFAHNDKSEGAYVATITFDPTADGMVKIDVAGTDYYIPFWNAAGLDNEWAD